jgi:hypothetical protein
MKPNEKLRSKGRLKKPNEKLRMKKPDAKRAF